MYVWLNTYYKWTRICLFTDSNDINVLENKILNSKFYNKNKKKKISRSTMFYNP